MFKTYTTYEHPTRGGFGIHGPRNVSVSTGKEALLFEDRLLAEAVADALTVAYKDGKLRGETDLRSDFRSLLGIEE